MISYLLSFCMILTVCFSSVPTAMIVANATESNDSGKTNPSFKTKADGDENGNTDDEEDDNFDPDAFCAANGHSLVEVKKSTSECGGGVNQDCWQCEMCERYFTTQEATTELKAEDIVVPENHAFNENDVKYEWVIEAGDDEEGEGSGESGSGIQVDENGTVTLDALPVEARAYVVCSKCGTTKTIESLDIYNDIKVENDAAGEIEDCTKITGNVTYTATAKFSDGTTLTANVKKVANSEHEFDLVSDQKIKDATCTEPAQYKAKCRYCATVSDEIILPSEKEDEQAKGHDYKDAKPSTQLAGSAGCVGNYYYAICNNCGEVSDTEMVLKEEENAKHEDPDGVLDESTVKEATCTEEGYSGDYKCSVCGEVVKKGEPVAKKPHTYTDKIGDTPFANENCEHGKLYHLVCDVCGQEATDDAHVKEVGEKTGSHVYDKEQVGDLITPATCTEPAVYGLKCDVCGETSKTNTVTKGEARGHHYTKKLPAEGEAGIKQVATCTDPEIRYVKCDDCDQINEALTVKTKDALGHDTEIVNKKAPTCTEEGYTGDTVCKRCKKTMKKGESIKATGHQHTEIQNAKKATCTEDGYTGDTFCKDCKKVIKAGAVIKATGHDFSKRGPLVSKATCTEPAKYHKQCSKCNAVNKEEIIEEGTPIGHAWDKGKVTKIPTTSSEGERTYTCANCGETRTESIPKVAKIIEMRAKATGKKKSASVSWSSVKGAVSYQIFEQRCSKPFSAKPSATSTKTSITRKALKKGGLYKYYIKAIDANGSVIGKSFVVHVATKDGKYSNAKSISVKKAKVVLKKGKSHKMSNKITKTWKGKLITHDGRFRYRTSNASVAVVKSGKIVAKGKGTATIRVIASNGVYKTIKVVVK